MIKMHIDLFEVLCETKSPIRNIQLHFAYLIIINQVLLERKL